MTSRSERRGAAGVADTASYIGVSAQHLRNMIARGEVPGVVRLGRRIVISRAAIDVWLESGAPTDGA